MGYILSLNEKINDGIKRITIEQIEDAVSQLNNTGGNFDTTVHEARKDFKKIRAVIRLVRFELGQAWYKRENIFFRDTGRLLSKIRDAAVMVESVEKLYKNYTGEIEQTDYTRLIKNLKRRTSRIRSQFKKNEQLVEGIKNMLTMHVDEVKQWRLIKDDFSIIEKGIKQVYQRGLNALNDVIENPSAENFHQWRKRVKYLWYHVRILEEAWKETMIPLAGKLDILSDYLGEEHDLAELRKLLIRDNSLFGDEIKLQEFLTILGRERLKLQTSAKSLVGYIYNETPDEFVKRIRSYWEQSKNNIG